VVAAPCRGHDCTTVELASTNWRTLDRRACTTADASEGSTIFPPNRCAPHYIAITR
jgi:hypothetical protein